jgi:predicted GIY-YIG superfamily endonuclease
VWFEDRSAAASMEVRLKALPRSAKLAWFERFAAATASMPATLDVGLASLTSRRLCSST